MVGLALRGYSMDLTTNNMEQILAYLASNRAPADFVLSSALRQIPVTGRAVENWQAARVSMICFQRPETITGGGPNGLWLFVVDSADLRSAGTVVGPIIAKINRLNTATWVQGGKLYLLGMEGDEPNIKEYF